MEKLGGWGISVLPTDMLTHGQERQRPNLKPSSHGSFTLLLDHNYCRFLTQFIRSITLDSKCSLAVFFFLFHLLVFLIVP